MKSAGLRPEALTGAIALRHGYSVGRGLGDALHKTASQIYPTMREWFEAVADVARIRPGMLVLALRDCHLPVPDEGDHPRWVNWVIYSNQNKLQLSRLAIAAGTRAGFLSCVTWPMPLGRRWYWQDDLRQEDVALICEAAGAVELLERSRDV